MTKHCVIPDTQVKKGVPLDHFRWAGEYISEKKPDVIVHIGDLADMPSLSSYDVGKKCYEGRTYREDIEAAIEAQRMLFNPIRAECKRLKGNKKRSWSPRFILTLGNHEDRINRAIEADRKLDGTIGIDDLRFREFGWEVIPYRQPIIVDGIAYCFTPEQCVLHTDWQYRSLGELKQGDKLVGFDEHVNTSENRQYKEAIVESVEFDYAEVFGVEDSSGTVTKVTGDHLWLVRPYGTGYKWVSTKDLKLGCEILKPFQLWKRSSDVDMVWLGGIIDGEGWLSKPNSDQGGIQIGISQNPGIVLDKVLQILGKYGYSFSVREHGPNKLCRNIIILGSLRDKIRLLIECGAIRLLDKLTVDMLGRLQSTGVNPKVLSVNSIGPKEIVKVRTSTGTLIVGGVAHHNCHFFSQGDMGRAITTARALVTKKHQSCVMGHNPKTELDMSQVRADGTPIIGLFAGVFYQHDEEYLGPQGNPRHRQIWMLQEVNNGFFYPQAVSMEYLRKHYA